MKKKVFLLWLLLLSILPLSVWSQEAYVVYSKDQTTLTFYYDNNLDSRKENAFAVYPLWNYNVNRLANEEEEQYFGEWGEFYGYYDYYDYEYDDEGHLIGGILEGFYDDDGNWIGPEDLMRYRQGKITSVIFDSSFEDARPTNLDNWFYGLNNLSSIQGLEYLNTSKVRSMNSMFFGCLKLERLNLSTFDTSMVTNMSSMFSCCYGLKSLDLSSFNTSNVTLMSYMFYNCVSLTNLNVSNFNTSNVKSMFGMFYGDCSLTDLKVDNFNTSKVTSMYEMFFGCSKLKGLDLSNFNLRSTTVTSNMLDGCIGVENLMLSASMENVEGNAFNGIGTTDIPCNIYVPEGFDFGMDTASPYFFWKGGCFVIKDDQPNIVYGTDLSLYDDVIYVENTMVRKGSQVCLSVKMNNVTPVRGFQFDLVLPEGVTIATDEDGEPLVQLSTERTTKRKMSFFDSALQDDGSLRVLCNSTGGYTFDGNSGEVCTIIVDVAQGISAGDHALVLQNVIYTDVDAKKYEIGDDVISKMTVTDLRVGDVNGDGEVDVADAALLANFILGREVPNIIIEVVDIDGDGIVNVTDIVLLINIIMTGNANGMARVNAVAQPGLVEMDMPDVAVSAGECVELPLLLGNFFTPVVAWQGDLILPQGVYVQSIKLNEARRNDHTIDWEVNSDGRVRLLCMSMTNQSLEEVEGVVAYVTLRTDKNITPGLYELQLNNLVMASNHGGVTPDEVKASLLVSIPTTINNIEKTSDGDMEFFGVNGAKIRIGQKGLRIVKDQYGNVRKESVK